jgi:hypothetical protein
MRRRTGQSTGLHYLDELLEQSNCADPDVAITAFNKLCDLGCDGVELGELLAWYSYSTVELKSGHKINVNSLDSWETALDPKDGKQPITLKELVQISRRAIRLLSDIKRLSRTPLVRQLVRQADIGPDDLLSSLRTPNGIFQGLVRLPKIIKPPRAKWSVIRENGKWRTQMRVGQNTFTGRSYSEKEDAEEYIQTHRSSHYGRQVGPQFRPDQSRTLANICRHVREFTCQWHDETLAHILNALIPYDQEEPITGVSLKQWRKRHGVIYKRGTRTD